MDKAAFERLYPDMLPGFCRLAQSLLRQPMDAQDAMQRAAVKAWQAPDKLPPGGFGLNPGFPIVRSRASLRDRFL